MKTVFISYRRIDSAGYTRSIYERLARYYSANQIFMDVDDIQPGTDFVQIIEDRLDNCKVVLVVIGQQWLDCKEEDDQRRLDNADDFVRLEIKTALERGLHVIPILIDGARMPSPGALPDVLQPLARRQALTITNDGFDYDIEHLRHVLSNFIEPMPENMSTSSSSVNSADSNPDTPVNLEKNKKKGRGIYILIGGALLVLFTIFSLKNMLHDLDDMLHDLDSIRYGADDTLDYEWNDSEYDREYDRLYADDHRPLPARDQEDNRPPPRDWNENRPPPPRDWNENRPPLPEYWYENRPPPPEDRNENRPPL